MEELNYHIHKSNIICPYCNEEYDDDDYEVSRDLESKVELECEKCGKNFRASAEIVFNTEAACELNNKEHELIETHVKGFFKCRVCKHYEHKDIQKVM